MIQGEAAALPHPYFEEPRDCRSKDISRQKLNVILGASRAILRQTDMKMKKLIALKSKLILCLALVLSGGWLGCSTAQHHSQWVKVDDIKITFASPPLSPRRDVPPPEAFYPAGEGGREFGSFTNIVAGRIARIQVTWVIPSHFKSENQTREFLRGLLANPKTQTWKYHVWSFGDDVPMLVADIKDTSGKIGNWIIWSYPSYYWAYQDGTGQWWWGDTEN